MQLSPLPDPRRRDVPANQSALLLDFLLESIAPLVCLMPVAAAAKLVADLEFQEASQPILDPTQYRALMYDIDDAKQIAAAFLAFRRTLDTVSARVEQRRARGHQV
jgi:hypothetical protein